MQKMMAKMTNVIRAMMPMNKGLLVCQRRSSFILRVRSVLGTLGTLGADGEDIK